MSLEKFKISGKRISLPEPSECQGWKFTLRPGGWVIAQSPSGERSRVLLSEVRGRLSASIGGKLWQGLIEQDQRASAGGSGASDSDLTAQFPGKVRKILVAEHSAVSEGDPLLLVEAMKMEFAIKAPFAGKVVRILVKEGQQLAPGDRFLDLVATPSTKGAQNG